MSVADPTVAAVVHRLVAAGCVAAAAEAAELLGAAPDESTLEAWLCRREQGEPLAWITRTVLFCGQTLHVAPGVYVPRIQSEELAQPRRDSAPGQRPGGRSLHRRRHCRGSPHGAVPTAAVIGVDVDVRAAACARRNGVPTAVADVAEPLRSHEGFDLVTAVAPYVPTGELRLLPADVQRYEPRLALDGGADGLDLVRRVIAAATRLSARAVGC